MARREGSACCSSAKPSNSMQRTAPRASTEQEGQRDNPSMKTSLLVLLALLVASSCAAPEASRSPDGSIVAFDVGATEFSSGDRIVVERVHSSTGQIAPGAALTVRGTYELRSRETALLYLGVTATTSVGAVAAVESRQHSEIALGSGQFELTYVVPGPGYPHVTFYDSATGKPFGGVYFGTGETLLQTKSWVSAR